MYTVKNTLAEIHNLDGWGTFIDHWSVSGRDAIVWSEQVENKHGSDAWRTAYIVRYWDNDQWIDTRYFQDEVSATEYARDFVNKPQRFPYPTD